MTKRIPILKALAARPGICQRALAERAGVSVATARRHLQEMVEEGAVTFEKDGASHAYRLSDGARLAVPAASLTEAEVEALSVGALAARPILAPTPLAAALETGVEKLRRRWLEEVFSFEPEADPEVWSFDGATGGRSSAVEPSIFRALLRAVREQSPVWADYYTASRDALTCGRRLAPLGFLVRSGAWLVAAADLDADTEGGPPIKDFALAGFRRVERLDAEHVGPPDGFDLALYARDRFGALDGEVEEVRLLVEAEAVPAFRRKLYNPTQQIEEERQDGSALVSFEAGGMDAVKAWVLSWGPKVRVLAPGSLAAAVAEAHREALRRYDAHPQRTTS